MEIINPKYVANRAAENWHHQYFKTNNNSWKEAGASQEEREDTYNKLLALGDSPKDEQVNEIIGNDSWTTTTRCVECRASQVPVVKFKGMLDHQTYCNKCLDEADKQFTSN